MTRLLVLGILDEHPMSGYDIKQTLEMTDAERWSGVLIGSIYHALKKMEIEGYVEVSSIEQTGHRQKAIYSITNTGRDYLERLIQDSLKELSVSYPSTLYSGLSFYNKTSIEACKEALIEQQKALALELAAVKQGLKAKEDAMNHDIPPMVSLVMDNMFSIIKLQQNFVDEALSLLEEQ